MYRRAISSIPGRLSILLFLFILFQLWIKPTSLAEGQPQSDIPPNSYPSLSKPPAPLKQRAVLELLQTRVIRLGIAPSEQLGQIRDDLNHGHYHAVETHLRALPKKLLTEKREKQFAAALWNNLGVQQEQLSGIKVSVKAFKQAVALAPQNPVALSNLTRAYWGLRDTALTAEFLESVLRVAPRDALSHIALADRLIEARNWVAATQHVNLAQPGIKTDPRLLSYSQRVTEKLTHQSRVSESAPLLRSAHPIELTKGELPLSPPPVKNPPTVPAVSTSSEGTTSGKFVPRSKESFTIQFDGKPDPEISLRIRAILEYAHEDVSKKFGYTLSSTIQVVLHTEQKFMNEGRRPAAADELYNTDSSIIHIPVDGAMEDLAVLSRVVRHQFVHALLDDKMRGHTTKFPTWLAEGLAIQLAEDSWPALEEFKQKAFPVIPLSALEGRWDRSQHDKLDVAYIESASAVQNLVDRFGMYGIRQIMNLLQAGQSLDSAMKQKWSVSYDDFQRSWAKTFTSSIRQG